MQKYNTIIFNLDGVIINESAYFDAAALTVNDLADGDCSLRESRSLYFYDDKLIILLKERGVETNWDLAYISYAFVDMGAEATYNYIKEFSLSAPELYNLAAERLAKRLKKSEDFTKRGGALWNETVSIMQEWYLGSELYAKNWGIPQKSITGLSDNEQLIIPKDKLQKLFELLKRNNISLRIATTRPHAEAENSLRRWGLYYYFEQNGFVDYSHIKNAETIEKSVNLSKPNPYIFIKAALGEDFPDNLILDNKFNHDFSSILIVGASVSDLQAAKAMNADFAAVLTGLDSENSQNYFTANGAQYVFDDVTALAALCAEN